MQRPVPTSNADTHGFWNALADGTLLYQRCERCGKVASYPRGVCSHCHSSQLVLLPSSRRGVIKSWTRVHRSATPAFKPDLPYIIALVDVVEGFPVMVNVRGAYAQTIAIGDQVVLEIADRGDGVKLLRAELERAS